MTTIAAIQGDGWVAIGCDSKATLETGRYLETVSRKVVDNNGILIAGAGSSRGSNILHYGWKAPKPTANVNLDVWVTTVLIPSIRVAFIEAGYEMKDDGDVACHDSEFILAIKGQLYHLFEDYSWEREERGIFVTGTGGELALGALEALNAHSSSTLSAATKHLSKAVSIAIRHDVNSGGKVHVYTQTKA
jgi:ATP-dependent protease HslVU (ClpYQ) peptidase subunit